MAWAIISSRLAQLSRRRRGFLTELFPSRTQLFPIHVDAQLKYRLTGAVILVLLAVLFVPELLTGPKTPAPAVAPEPSAPTAAEGAPLRSYDIDLSDPGNAAPAADAEADAVEAGEMPAAPGTAAHAVLPPTAAAPRATPDATSRSPRAAAPASGPDSVASPSATIPSTAPAATPGPLELPTRGFAVQVGSFASRASADRLAAELRGRRFETFVSPVRSAGRQLYRVRVGPVEDRAAAQALAARLRSAGQSGSVVPLP